VKGASERAAYFGHRLESHQREINPFWVAEADTSAAGTVDASEKAIDYVRRLSLRPRRIGVEMGFLPLDAGTALRNAFAKGLKNRIFSPGQGRRGSWKP
jgi:hypothetical protein